MNLELQMDEMARDIAMSAMDKTTYKGKTLREWIDKIMGYAEAMDDVISRSALLEDLGASCYDLNALTGITGDERTLQEAILQFPSIDAVQVITNGQDTTYLRVKNIDDLRSRLIIDEYAGHRCAVFYEDSDDAVPVVRCKDCINYKKRHVLTADGEEKSYEEMPPEAFGGLDDMYVTMEYGINVGGKCMLDEGRGYPVDKSVFRSPNDYCSYGVRMDGDPHDSPGQ